LFSLVKGLVCDVVVVLFINTTQQWVGGPSLLFFSFFSLCLHSCCSLAHFLLAALAAAAAAAAAALAALAAAAFETGSHQKCSKDNNIYTLSAFQLL